jgi:hypothetical protein
LTIVYIHIDGSHVAAFSLLDWSLARTEDGKSQTHFSVLQGKISMTRSVTHLLAALLIAGEAG